MSKTEIAKRYILFVLGLFFAAIGVAFTKHGELGVSPISSVANVLSCKFSTFSLGTWLIIWNCILIVGEIVVLRKKFQLIQLLQVPLSFLFGWFKLYEVTEDLSTFPRWDMEMHGQIVDCVDTGVAKFLISK